jgi:HD-like signal output (HDOD) protein
MTVPGNSPRVDLKEVLADAQLAALPQSAIRLLELSRDPANGPGEFAVPIEADPGLTGQVLKFVNSSYFGFAREISSVNSGLKLVGVRTIKNFALWNAIFSLIPNPKCGPFDLKGLWQDSLRRALFARAVARLLGLKAADDVFTAALLQDMAVPVLAKAVPQFYLKLLEARHEGKNRLSALERRVFGWTHGEAAGALARQWNLPEDLVALVEGHSDLQRWSAASAASRMGLCVALSALLPSTADPIWVEFKFLEQHCEAIASQGSPSVAELLDQVDREYVEFAPVMRVAMPAKSLGDCYHELMAPAD